MNINEYRNRFYNLLESKLGNVKPLICENELDEDRIDLSQTYLSPEKMKELKDTNKTNTDPYFPSVKVNKVSDIKGNQFKDAGLMNTVPIPIEVTVVPAPVTPGIVFRVCPTTIPDVVIPLINVVVIPILPDAVATPTKVIFGVNVTPIPNAA